MSTPPTTLPESGPAASRDARRRFPRLRDARIRSKLALILVVPVAAVVALSAARLVESGQRAVDAGLVHDLADLATDVSALAHEAHRERMDAARLLGAQGVQDPSTYNAQVRRTDDRIDTYKKAREALGEVPNAVEVRLDRIDDHLSTLNGTRQDIIGNDQVSLSEAILRYGVVIEDLVAYGEVIGQIAGEGRLADSLRAMSSFANAKSATAEEEAVVYGALITGRGLDEEQYSSFIATLTSQQEALLSFSLTATGVQRRLVDTAVTGDAVILAEQASAEVARAVGGTPRTTAADAQNAIGAVNDLMRWSEIQMEGVLDEEAAQARSDVLRQVILESLIVFLTLAIAIFLAVVLARSLARSLTQLRMGALSVAEHDLPDAVAKLRDVRSLGEGGVEAITQHIRDPIRLTNRDEVGEVAKAFNVVHREAVRIAAEQAALRTSVSAMFLNLARRSQALVDRMIGELDHIERTEEDPKRLSQLFQLDHLATRMRRNDENLLVLAGADSAPPRRDDALLIDAVRAAQSEVELYNRIEFGTVDSDIFVAAHAVNDVVRLLAELLDNATRFSPPTTIVVAEARRIRDYVLIQVEDRGLGIGEEQMESLNRRLAEPPPMDVDVAAFRLMGLAVVSRLASRYGIQVELRHNTEGGTVAHVSLPSGILVLPQQRVREVPAAIPPPRVPRQVEQAPAPSTNGSTPSSWSDGAKPALPTRKSGATLGDSWSTQQSLPAPPVPPSLPAQPVAPPQVPQAPAPSQWDAAPAAPMPVDNDVTAVHPSLAPAEGSPYAQGYGAALVSTAYAAPAPAPLSPPPPREEMPIFREMEASWFRTHDSQNLEPWAMPTAGHPPPPTPADVAAANPAASTAAASSAGMSGAANSPSMTSPAASASMADTQLIGTYNGYAAPAAPPAPPVSPVPPPASPAPYVSPAPAPAPPPYVAPAQAPTPAPAAPAATSWGGGGRSTSLSDMTMPIERQPAEVPRVSAPPLPPRGYAPPEVPADATTTQPAVPRPRASGENGWQTRADEGWRRASEAAAPAAGGTTRSGLPKRVPQAQLVPGGVEPTGGRDRSRRTPDEVRGLLSAYHRGVQRGRNAGEAGADQHRQTKETRA